MARTKQVESSALKETYQHFSKDEMEMLAAHCYRFQGLPRYNNVALGTLAPVNRPWTPYERFWKAVDAFDKKFRENPEAGLQFKIADYDPANRVMDSGTMLLDQSEQDGSREAWFALINWDEKKLQSYVNGVGGKINEAYGFKKLLPDEISPMNVERKAVTESIEDIARKVKGLPVEATLHSNPVDALPIVSEPTEKKRGMPKGGWPKKVTV